MFEVSESKLLAILKADNCPPTTPMRPARFVRSRTACSKTSQACGGLGAKSRPTKPVIWACVKSRRGGELATPEKRCFHEMLPVLSLFVAPATLQPISHSNHRCLRLVLRIILAVGSPCSPLGSGGSNVWMGLFCACPAATLPPTNTDTDFLSCLKKTKCSIPRGWPQAKQAVKAYTRVLATPC